MLRNRIYYGLKPFIPQPLRMGLRRHFALRRRPRVSQIWPIMPGSECPPKGWSGWPEGKKFAVVLTHDVEGPSGLEKCRQLMELERELGFRSSFNFIPEGSYRLPSTLRQELLLNGFEIGVHDLRHDGRLFRSANGFQTSAAKINRYLQEWGAVGFRSAFMLHELDWFHQLKIDYDMSTFDTDPFEPQPEGRQTIFPFLVRERGLNDDSPARQGAYVELPYTLPQDSTLFLLLQETTPEIWLRKLDWIASNGGMALINTHPDYMSFDNDSCRSSEYPSAFYKEFLACIRDRYSGTYWDTLPREVASYIMQSQSQRPLSALLREERLHQKNGAAATVTSPLPEASQLNGYPSEAPEPDRSRATSPEVPALGNRLNGKHGAVLLFSHYPADPRPRRAAEALAAEGVSIDLICLQESADEPRHEMINGVRVMRVPLKRRRRGALTYIWQYAAFIAVCFYHLTVRSLGRRYDFVHVHNMPDILVVSALVPKLCGAKIVLDLHDPMPELLEAIFDLAPQSYKVRTLERMERWSIGFSDLVLTVSRTFQDVFASRSCSSEKVKVVLNSPDERIFRFRQPQLRHRTKTDPESPFVVLYHGSLLKRNGLDLAVDALEIVRRDIPTANLFVCGRPTAFFHEVMDSVARRGLTSAVRYLGAKNLEGIVDVIQHCDLGVIPNHRNIFTELNTPTRILECLALGKPVIAPRARGIWDYFGEQGLVYFELGNARDLAEKIKYVYYHRDEVEQTVKLGQRIYQDHTWTSEKKTLISAFNALLSS